MTPKIGLVGVPLETVPIICDDYDVFPLYYIPAYIPGITDKTREAILEKAAKQKISIKDLGETCLGEDYNLCFNINYSNLRLHGLPHLYKNYIRMRDMNKLEEAREDALKKSKEYDLFIAVGASHLGAIVLYEEKDNVARLDYHADFVNKNPDKVTFSYSSYMDWVKKNIKKIDVTNYFVKNRENGIVFGKDSTSIDDNYSYANHFDIDVDCFDPSYQIQAVYKHVNGSSKVTPEMVLSMIEKAKPRKLGVWEYRLRGDYNNTGLDFIVDSIRRAVNN